MAEYKLYLESGPRQKTTMVHVLDLLGCFARGSTTPQAIAAAPQAVQDYLAFLRRHGEDTDAHSGPISLAVAEHVTQGFFLGQGSPSIIFGPEREPVGPDEMARYLRWLDWARQDILALFHGLPSEALDAPCPGARTLREILEHVWQAERWYVRNLGPLPSSGRHSDIFEKLAAVRQVNYQRLTSLSAEERGGVFYAYGPGHEAGQQDPWTARKAIRRALEHQWEHLNEIAQRLANPTQVLDKQSPTG